MIINPFQTWYPNFEQIVSPDVFFASVSENYTLYQQNGFFKQLSTEAIFIYQIYSAERSHIGLMVCTPTEAYNNGHILKHEKTLDKKELKTSELLLERRASVKPVLLTYPSVEEITLFLQAYITHHVPFYSTHFDLEAQTHQFWKIEEPVVVHQLQQLFREKVPQSIIADGHHRTITMSILNKEFKEQPEQGDFGQLLVALFGADQLHVQEFNRVVKGKEGLNPTDLLAKMAQLGTLEQLSAPQKPQQKHELIIFLNQTWYRFSWSAAILASYNETSSLLDVNLLNDKVLRDLLDIQDIQSDARIQYVEGTKGIAGLQLATLQNAANIGFYLYPISIKELITLVQQGQLLPPKSTYFEPRIKNGLLVKSL